MRYHLIAAAFVVGIASPAFAQSHTLPTGSENAAQPPIDWTVGDAPAFGVPRVREGRSVAIDGRFRAHYPDRAGDFE